MNKNLEEKLGRAEIEEILKFEEVVIRDIQLFKFSINKSIEEISVDPFFFDVLGAANYFFDELDIPFSLLYDELKRFCKEVFELELHNDLKRILSLSKN